jgi:hypothetical protein
LPPLGCPSQAPCGPSRPRVMLLPPGPMAPRIVGHTRCTLAPLATCGQALGRLGPLGPCPQWRLGGSRGQGRSHLPHLRLGAVTGAEDHQRRRSAWLTPMGARDHAALHRCPHQRPWTAIAPIPPVPGGRIPRLAPGRAGGPGTLGTAPPAALRRQRDRPIPPRRVRRHGPHGRRTHGRTATTTPLRAPPLVVTCQPPRWPRGPVVRTPRQGHRGTRARGAGRCGPTRVVPAGLLLGPCLWPRPPGGDPGVPRAGDRAHGEGPLAVSDLSPTATPWPCHSHRRPTALGTPRRIAPPHPSAWSHGRLALAPHRLSPGGIVPRVPTHAAWQRPARRATTRGKRCEVLAFDVRPPATHRGLGVLSGSLTLAEPHPGRQEGVEAGHDRRDKLRGPLTFVTPWACAPGVSRFQGTRLL